MALIWIANGVKDNVAILTIILETLISASSVNNSIMKELKCWLITERIVDSTESVSLKDGVTIGIVGNPLIF